MTNLADIFTVGRPYIDMMNLKISVQTDEPFWRYSRYNYRHSILFSVLYDRVFSSKFAFSQQR